jgi:cytochrome c oxidase subunit III
VSEHTGGYYIPQPSSWPIKGSLALLTLAAGFIFFLYGNKTVGLPVLGLGFAILFYMLFGWFGAVVRESESGKYDAQVDRSFRWSMGWFIFSEVMFFAAFFGALFYARQMSLPWLADTDNSLLWPGFKGVWPSTGPAIAQVPPMSWWLIPTLNTGLLLTSGWTVTMAHHALKANKRQALVLWLAATVALGATFLGFQVYEYHEAAFGLGAGIYGATFFMLTGFHGFHVTLGTIMLFVILMRCIKGHFKPEHHFAFEAVAWYWHFVDVVWLILFVFVYCI